MAPPAEQNHTPTGAVRNFEAFFSDWLIRQESFSHQLLNAITPENIHKNEQHQRLIDQVFSHYQQYYTEKSVAAKEDPFLFISPPWFTPLEKTFLWIGGFRPSLIFRLSTNSFQDLTPDQRRTVEETREEIRREERELGQWMARVQESAGSVPLMNLARRCGAGNYMADDDDDDDDDDDEGEVSEMESAVKELQNEMLEVLEAADAMRGTAVRKVVQILNPIQTVKLMATAARFHLRLRRWGLERGQSGTAAATPTATGL